MSEKVKEILGQQCPHQNVRYMDDNDCLILNHNYRKCKELMAQKFAHQAAAQDGGQRMSLIQPMDETTARLTEQIKQFQYYQVSSMEVVDVLT